MAKKTLWQRLNEDVRLSDIVTFNKEDRATGSKVGVSSKVERIWQQAAADASRRGIPVTEVLRELGFDVEAPSESAAVRSPEQKRNLLRSLNWDEVDTDTPTPRPDGHGTIDVDESWPFDDVLATDVQIGLDDVQELAQRLGVLGGRQPSAIATALDDPEARDNRWRAAIGLGIPAGTFEAVVRSIPFFPPRLEDEGFGDRLLIDELVSFKQYHEAQRQAGRKGTLTFAELVQSGAISERGFIEAVSAYAGVPLREGEPKLAADSVVDAFPSDWARAFHVVPIESAVSERAVAAPFAPMHAVRDAVERAVGRPVEFFLVTPTEADALVEQFLASRAERPKELPRSGASPRTPAPRRSLVGDYSILKAAVQAKSAVSLVRMLFDGAIQANATDIHLERSGESGRVRYRIDGVLHVVMDIEPTLYDEVVSRVKILADMDITERRRPQDGHLHLKLGGQTYDLRIASVPTKRGEKVAIRLASTGRVGIELESIGLVDSDLEKLRDIITRPYGIVLATGPVGSGKTTTLYAALNEFDREATNVATIEDPVEIELDGANQVEVNYSLGLDFATGLRALLRQDPDTLLIGEIRDQETSQIAARAGMTGRMVFSTLHANDSVGAVTTLKNFGLTAHLVASSLQGVVAQRLMRRLCDSCKSKRRASPQDREMFKDHGLELPKPLAPYGPTGCDECFGSGYNGRLGVFEVLRVDRDIRQMILEECPEREIRQFAIERGLRSIQQDALDKIASGDTSIEEYRRVLRF